MSELIDGAKAYISETRESFRRRKPSVRAVVAATGAIALSVWAGADLVPNAFENSRDGWGEETPDAPYAHEVEGRPYYGGTVPFYGPDAPIDVRNLLP